MQKSAEILLYSIFLQIIFFLCELCQAAPIVTADKFMAWKATTICNDETRVKNLCVYVAKKYSSSESKETIGNNSGCRNSIKLHLGGAIVQFSGIGMCYVTSSVTKCLTKGQADNDLIIFNYNTAKSDCEVEELITEEILKTPAWRLTLNSWIRKITFGYVNL